MSQTGLRSFYLTLIAGLILASCAGDNKPSSATPKAETGTPTSAAKVEDLPEEKDSDLLEAKVLQALHTFGPNTTYLELQTNQQSYWVASSKIDAKAGDRVRYSREQTIRMEKFNSKSLNRVFATILFIAEIEILDPANKPSEKALDAATLQDTKINSKEN